MTNNTSKYSGEYKAASAKPKMTLEGVDWKQADEKYGLIEFCNGRDQNGRLYWAYLTLFPSKYREFKARAAAGESFHLLDYGEELASGWGKHPPEHVKKELEEKYGLNHKTSLEDDVRKQLEKTQTG
ncbi:MAG: hypothetical protein HND56_09300 [Pseudomonadota bacterium]|nr:hypothetical protein [Pseudomonadota bacterium]QKK05871.1 MAG: hypothetical protein HND56_09300 [Pseudomonadota bacterium]